MEASNRPAVVLLSGGQDSTTCLAWARRHFAEISTIAFDYGQRHQIELKAAEDVARRAGVTRHRLLPVKSLAELGGNSLTADIDVEESMPAEGLPNTFVPGRNVLFLTLAAAWAYQLGVHDLVTGVCQTDYSGYPDCRRETIDAVEQSLSLGMDFPVRIHTPLMHITKAESITLAQEVEAMELLAYSHTCYNGAVPPCGRCPACVLRAKGFEEAGCEDPLIVRLNKES